MDIYKVQKLVRQLSEPNDVYSVSISNESQIDLLDKYGNTVKDGTLKEFDAVVFKATHPIAPRKWRSWDSKPGKEF